MIVYRCAFNHGFTVTDFLGFRVTQWSAIMFYCSLFTAAPSTPGSRVQGPYQLTLSSVASVFIAKRA